MLSQLALKAFHTTRVLYVGIALSALGASACFGQVRYGILDTTHWSNAVAGGLAGSTALL